MNQQVGRITQLTTKVCTCYTTSPCPIHEVQHKDVEENHFTFDADATDRFEFDADSMRWWYKFPCLACVHRNVTVTAHCLACTHYPTTFTAEYKPTRGSTQ